MIYNIPKWPKSSDLKHYATTWILAKDINFENVEEKVEKSETYLLAWEVKKLIPTGEVWYIKALRHLEDEDGNDINNKKWIGPKPVFNDASTTNEYLAPKFHISEPYIADIRFTPGEKIELIINNIKTNVKYNNTQVYLEDLVHGESILKAVNLEESKYKVEFTKDEIDFSKLSLIKFIVTHTASRSVISNPVVEVVDLKKAFYTIISNTKNLDPVRTNYVKIKPTNYGGVTVIEADLMDKSGAVLRKLDVKDNSIVIPKILSFNSSYILNYVVAYTDENGKKTNIKDSCNVTTRDVEEIKRYDASRVYTNILTLKNSLSSKSPYLKFKNKDINFNTEEFFTYLIPLVNKKTNKLAFFGYDDDKGILSLHKDTTVNLKSDFSIRLLNKTTGLLQVLGDKNEVVLKVFTYDQYEDEITIIKTINTGLVATTAAIKKFVELQSGLFVVGLDKDDKSKVLVKELDMDTYKLTTVSNFKYTHTITDVSPVEFGSERILIMPADAKEFRILEFSNTDKIIVPTIALPDGFRNIGLLPQSLYNNNITCFKLNATDKEMDFFTIDYLTSDTKTISRKDNDTKKISNLYFLKDGDCLTTINNKENDSEYTEFWIFK